MNSALVSSNYSVCFGISNRCPLGDEFDMHSSEIRTNESEMPVLDGGVIAKVLVNAMGLQLCEKAGFNVLFSEDDYASHQGWKSRMGLKVGDLDGDYAKMRA